jgi:hypothetical protein
VAPARTWTDDGKTCIECQVFKPITEFYVYPRRTGTPNVFPRCKPCHNAYGQRWRKGRGHELTLKKRYGLSVEQYDDLLVRQGGVCAICHRPPTERSPLQVDHDHACCPQNAGWPTCGQCVRGLLCRSCNTALNLLDDPVKRQRAVVYLGLDSQLFSSSTLSNRG